MRALRIIAKILLFPVTLLQTITVVISMFIIERLAGLLNIASGILFFGQYSVSCNISLAGQWEKPIPPLVYNHLLFSQYSRFYSRHTAYPYSAYGL